MQTAHQLADLMPLDHRIEAFLHSKDVDTAYASRLFRVSRFVLISAPTRPFALCVAFLHSKDVDTAYASRLFRVSLVGGNLRTCSLCVFFMLFWLIAAELYALPEVYGS